MNSVSKAALAVAIVLGAPGFMAATPSAAQKKQEAAGPQLKVSASFRKAFVDAQAAVAGTDLAGAEAKIAAVESQAANADEKYFAAQLRYDLETKKKNNAGRSAALDTLIASGFVTGSDLGNLHFLRGHILNQDRKYPQALVDLNKARELGSTQSDLPLQRAVALFQTNDAAGGAASLGEAIKAQESAGNKAPEAWYKIAVSELYKAGNKALAAEWLDRQIAAYPSPEAWRSLLMVYMEQASAKGVTLDADHRLDIYRLVRATKGLAGENDYFQYAETAQRRGLPWEVRSVIDEGRAAGKIPSGSADINQLYTQAAGREKAEVPLAQEEKRAAAAANGALALSTGDAYLGSRNFPKAIELYRLALGKGGVDANLVNTRLGIAMALSGDKPGAKTAFSAVSGSPRAEIARFWTTWVDQTG